MFLSFTMDRGSFEMNSPYFPLCFNMKAFSTYAHTFKTKKSMMKKAIKSSEKMIEFHVRDVMNRMIATIEEDLSTSPVRKKSSWEMAKDWIASQSPFSSSSRSSSRSRSSSSTIATMKSSPDKRKTTPKKKKKKTSKWKFIRKLFGLKKKKRTKKSNLRRRRSGSADSNQSVEDLRDMMQENEETEQENEVDEDESHEESEKNSDEDDDTKDDDDDGEGSKEEKEEEEVEENEKTTQEDGENSKTSFETLVFENNEHTNEHGIGTVLLLAILLFAENENELRLIRIPHTLMNALDCVSFGPGSKAPMGHAPSWVSRRALSVMQKQLSSGEQPRVRKRLRLRRFSCHQHSVGSLFSAMTLRLLNCMCKFSSSFREILLNGCGENDKKLITRRCMEIVLCDSVIITKEEEGEEDSEDVVLHAEGLIECSKHSRALATQGHLVGMNSSILRSKKKEEESSSKEVWKPLSLRDLKNLLKLYFQTHDREKLRYVDSMASIHIDHQPLLHLQLFHRHGEPLFDPAPPQVL